MVGGSDQHNTAYRLGLFVFRTRLIHMKVVGKLGKLVRMWVGSQKDRHDILSKFIKEVYCERK